MEGPSLYLAAEQLIVFKGKKVRVVAGNTKMGKERLLGKEVLDIFAWGKHLVFQFDVFALRIHFLLFGTYEATINGVTVTGDYRRTREPRLLMQFINGDIKIFNGSVKFIEGSTVKQTYDFSIDIMSKEWSGERVYSLICRYQKGEEIADVLLNQEIFAGVGNIIKNEVLSNIKINPKERVKNISENEIKNIIQEARRFSFQFLEWRKEFQLRAHLKTHRKSTCQHCGARLVREKTGKRERWSYYCTICQPLRK